MKPPLSETRKKCREAIEKYADILKLEKGTVLDIGIAGDPPPGENFRLFGAHNIYQTLDINRKFEPTFVGDICNAPFEDNTFDLVILSNTLEHIWDFRKAISEVARITKKYAIIDSPFMHPYHGEEEFGDWWRFTTPALQRLCQEVGFEIIDKIQSNELSSVLCQKIK